MSTTVWTIPILETQSHAISGPMTISVLKNRQKSGNKAKCKQKRPNGVEKKTVLQNGYLGFSKNNLKKNSKNCFFAKI